MPLSLDDSLINDARSGGSALELLITAVWPEAYRIALGILRDRGLAEDAAQEACVAMARSLSSLNSTDAFFAWCYRIIISHAITAARRRPRTQNLNAVANEGILFDQSDAMDLYNALAALPHKQRGAIILHYYVGLNSGEIATATGLPRSTVRFHLMLACRSLRKALSTTEQRAIPKSEEAIPDVH